MKKIAYDSMKLDALKIVEDSKCCLKVNAVISREGVYLYDDGWALKSRMELLKATRTARHAKLTLHGHPDSKVIMSQNQLYGGVEKPFFDRNKIRATLNFDKAVTPRDILQKVKDAVTRNTGLDVSIGFYYQPDFTPGFAQDVNTGEKRRYDYVMRDILIDHVTVMFDGKLHGRCTFPQCGIGVDAMMRRISFQEDIIEKRGSQWCVIHHKPGPKKGTPIKCFPTKEQALAMHRAIQARKHGATRLDWITKYLFDQDKRPPKDWMDTCKSKAQSFADDPGAFCGHIWYHEPELKASFGGSSVQIKGGDENMSLEELYYPERSKEFNECVKQRMAEGMTREEAEAHCVAPTKPADEPKPFEALDQEDLSPWQACIKEQMQAGMTQEEAAVKCKQSNITKSDQDAAFDNCVERKMEEGMAREEAEKECRVEHPVAGEAEPEKTPLERCVEEQMEQGKSAEEAKSWCEAELAGEHEAVDALIQRSKKLINLKRQSDIEKRRQHRRHPL